MQTLTEILEKLEQKLPMPVPTPYAGVMSDSDLACSCDCTGGWVIGESHQQVCQECGEPYEQ